MSLNFGLLKSRDQYTDAGELEVTTDGNPAFDFDGDDLKVTTETPTPDNQNYDGSGNLETVNTDLSFTGSDLDVTKPITYIPIYIEKAVWDDDIDEGAVMNMGDYDTTTFIATERNSSGTQYISGDFQTLLTDVIVNIYYSVRHEQGTGLTTAYIETSTNDSDWTTQDTLIGALNATTYKSYSEKITFRYFRLRVTYTYSGGTQMQGRINEFRIYQEAA